jgi:predicted CopG family antitoxin
MPSRNMAIKDDVYRRLAEAKTEGESFSDVIDRLLEGRNDLMAFAGALSGDAEFEAALKDIAAVRKRTVLRV